MHNLRSCAQFAPGCRVQINLHHLESRSNCSRVQIFSRVQILKTPFTWPKIHPGANCAHDPLIHGHIESQMIFHYRARLFYLLVYRFLCETWPYEGGNKNKNKIAIVESEKIKYIKRDRSLRGVVVKLLAF